jgi:hypothetical protein
MNETNYNRICKLSTNDGDDYVEARKESSGFSVYLFNSEYANPERRKHESITNYSWKEFAGALMTLDEGFIGLPPTAIKVDNESEIRGYALKLAWGYQLNTSIFLDFLMQQSESSIDFLEALAKRKHPPYFSDEVIEALDTILDGDNEKDLLNIIESSEHVGLFSSLTEVETMLTEAAAKVEEKAEQKRELKIKEKKQTLAPFIDSITSIASSFNSDRTRIGAGISGSKPSQQEIVTRWLKNYVLEHGEIPNGIHEVKVPFLGGYINVGKIEFDGHSNCAKIKS